MTAALKEWSAIVRALVLGEQTIILRKGGIAEGRGGFQPQAGRFWLFPTRFHAQPAKLKPAAAPLLELDAAAADPSTVTLSGYAEIVASTFVPDWPRLVALDGFHLWTEATVRDRYDWSRPPGVTVLIVRIHRLIAPLTLSPTAEMGGCKSWIELPLDPSAHPAVTALDDRVFAAQAERIRAVLR